MAGPLLPCWRRGHRGWAQGNRGLLKSLGGMWSCGAHTSRGRWYRTGRYRARQRAIGVRWRWGGLGRDLSWWGGGNGPGMAGI